MITLKEYKNRRQSLLAKMASNSAALFFSVQEKHHSTTSNNYHYQKNSNFWYFTGFNEPYALFILFKKNKNNHKSILFNQSRDKYAETWTGRRLGQITALKRLGVTMALPWEDIDNQLYLLLNKLDKVYHAQGESAFADQILFRALRKLRQGVSHELKAPTMLIDWRFWVYEMRLIKSQAELLLIRRACKISALGHVCAIKRCQPGLYEYHLEGELHYEFNRQGAPCTSYNTIVASGKNACILHYTENSSYMRNGNLVLIDSGCNYQGYASDISRTFPINGRFSKEQRIIYTLVLDMLNYALKFYGPGYTMLELHEKIIQIMVSGLWKIGIIRGNMQTFLATQGYQRFFMHRLSHFLGLDVHDMMGNSGFCEQKKVLEPRMVLTIEPGIYIPCDSDIPFAYRGIGVRIEETILITDTGNENLTDLVIKEVYEIEQLMAKVHQKR
ncbi:Xaa-Pro aminopeptidase [secondary endosymbiont of Heteropsylla cubana]|uniref:Xaa-Pro aminopeptidase n=1 Tax=secondary endosymbiont of Heteropsylla cubana TaxID=134287 RepID=J3TGD2_9ENTR|nr:Xaa-Pro aminopeptidase [secondary endosymbiont of Heteropsylla cubana]AFP85467.1 Xaa-Pro aminopeptidase [secondary endosymbiont of Heteropsylla cubana]